MGLVPFSRLLAQTRVGDAAEMQAAKTRSYLADGRVVGWFGADNYVIDAELNQLPPPLALTEKFGADNFWQRWTQAECQAKARNVPVIMLLAEFGLPLNWPSTCTAVLPTYPEITVSWLVF